MIEKILRHCGLWHASRAPPGEDGAGHDPDEDSDRWTAASVEPRERMFVDIDTYEDRTITASENSFHDKIAPLVEHMYRWPANP